MRDSIRTVVLALTTLSVPSTVLAQGSGNSGQFVSGPLVWTPTFQLQQAGVDSNVFNAPTDAKEDVVGNARAEVDSVLTLGLLQATTQGTAEYMYFERYTRERGVNAGVRSRMAFPVSRFSPDVTVAWAHMKERSTNEIDTRAPRTDFGYALGIQTAVTPRITVLATGGKQTSTYERGFTFRDIEIAQLLDRETLQATVTGRVTLTPLTEFATTASYGRDTFPFRAEAATDNVRVDAGLEFAPDAIISGRAAVGYHSMQPTHGGVSNTVAADFRGVTAAVDITYKLLELTRFTGHFGHDSNYSIYTNQPFYVSTAGGIEVLQALFGPVDLNVHGTREQLAYDATDLAAAHTDVADTFGGGLSVRVAPQSTIALIYDHTQRRSSAGEQFGYERRRIYTTVTYGF